MSSGGIVTTIAGNRGTITTAVGTGEDEYNGHGMPAAQAEINLPRCVAALPDGGFLVVDTGNHRIGRVWPTGTITTADGTGSQGYSGDGGPATSAMLSVPFDVVPTKDGGMLIVDVGNQRIRRVTPDGTITTVAGNWAAGFSGDDGGRATAASLNQPHDVAALAHKGFLIADTANNRIRRVWPDRKITTIAGTGVAGFAGDGEVAGEARLRSPKGVAVFPDGLILVADEQNDRIRFVGAPRPPVNLRRPLRFDRSTSAIERSPWTRATRGRSRSGHLPTC